MNRPKTCPLPGEVKSRINRIAHAMAAEHEAATRQRLLDGIQCLAVAGASLQAMHCHLDAVEASGKPPRPLKSFSESTTEGQP